MNTSENSTSEKKNGFKETTQKWLYLISLAVALLGITYDLTAQEYVRELQASESIHLNTLLQFLHDNFAGDIGNAFAYVFGLPAILEAINLEIKKSEDTHDSIKYLSEKVSLLAPYFMALFFLIGALDGETTQHIFKWGTPDKLDLVGAVYGTMVALASILKFRKKVYPRAK